VLLSNEVECDEAYVVAGHKGQPEVVKSKERTGRRRRLQGKAGRGTLEKERPPVFGMMQRGGQVVINLIANVKQKTIEPLIKDTIMPGTLIFTDEYSMYARLHVWGYEHKSVNHGRGEFARDDDGDGLCEVHVNTMEGFQGHLVFQYNPDESQRLCRLGRQLAASCRNVRMACPPQQSNRGVAERRHDLGDVATAHLGAVFIEGHIAHPM
jgi:transposase-like protein